MRHQNKTQKLPPASGYGSWRELIVYWCFLKPSRNYLRGFLIAAWAGAKITEFSFPETSFHFQFSLWLFFRKPRVCGEKAPAAGHCSTDTGSPLRMRGKVRLLRPEVHELGITPAYAGKRRCVPGRSRAVRDYPRVCGEKRLYTASALLMSGSPPRMRGKGALYMRPVPRPGITPAYAGKSPFQPVPVRFAWDHPRVCGEKA